MDSMGMLVPFMLIAAAILIIVPIAAIFKIFNIANLLQTISNDLKKLVPPDEGVEENAEMQPEELTPSGR